MPTPTNWIVPVSTDLNKVLSQTVISSIDANVGTDGQNPLAAVDQNKLLRSQEVVRMAINRVRGAIQAGGRIPLSLTSSSVPPEAEMFTLAIAAWEMVAAQPDVGSAVIIGPHSNVSPFYNEYQKAEAWLKSVTEGSTAFTSPNDPAPTGVNGVDGYPTPLGVNYGDVYGTKGLYDAVRAGTAPAMAAPYDMTTTS